MKKALSLILTVVMLLSIFTCVPVVAQALDLEGTCGDSVTYTFDVSTGLLTLGGSGETGSYYKDSPFYNHSEIKKVVVGSGVTKLGTMLFRKCAGLKTVDLSGAENLVSIGDSAFEECTSLTRIINPLSHNFKYIYSGAFFSCTSLKSYRLPNDLEIIDDNTFNDCRALESITIPATVTKIENYAFHRCYELKDIYFEGTYSEWSSITIESDHIGLEDVEVHYQSTCDYIGDNAIIYWTASGVKLQLREPAQLMIITVPTMFRPLQTVMFTVWTLRTALQRLAQTCFPVVTGWRRLYFPEL